MSLSPFDHLVFLLRWLSCFQWGLLAYVSPRAGLPFFFIATGAAMLLMVRGLVTLRLMIRGPFRWGLGTFRVEAA